MNDPTERPHTGCSPWGLCGCEECEEWDAQSGAWWPAKKKETCKQPKPEGDH